MRKLLITIAVLSLAGIAVSAYALWQHYAPLGSAFCNIGETFSCDLVNKSAFSEAFGIPVALIGILGYVGIGALALAAYTKVSPPLVEGEREGVAREARGREIREFLSVLLITSLLGLAFSLYLTYIEFFVIGAVCILCVISQTLILAITTFSAIVWKRRYQPSAR